jgi:hypothetical protein
VTVSRTLTYWFDGPGTVIVTLPTFCRLVDSDATSSDVLWTTRPNFERSVGPAGPCGP